MSFKFTQEDIKGISSIFGECKQAMANNWVWQLTNAETKQSLMISLYNDIELGKEIKGSMVSVQTLHGYFEIHDCKTFLIFEPDEVIFINADEEYVSCMIIGKQGTCSMYSNIRRELLNSDFNNLDPAVLLSAMQLSLTENAVLEI